MRTFFAIASILFSLVIISTSQTFAYSVKDGVCSTHPEATVCQVEEKDPITGSQGLLAKIANIVSYVAGAAAIILILVGAIRYITSGGDPGNVKKAKDAVLYALIGVAIVILARSLIFFIVSFYK